MSVRTRFAPSPTGSLHIGGVRTALFSWLYARRYGGEYILRIEDTDRERSTEAAVQVILDAFEWLDLKPDEGPFFQSRRLERYREVADGMIEAGTAYRCYCTPTELAEMRAQQSARGEKPRYDGRCRNRTEPRPGVTPAVRFRNPDEGQVVVDDLVHGRVVFENAELDDLVIMRSDGTPTYNFGVVVDDLDLRITHVVRGDDHVNNTPRQINILRALGAALPVYAHVPTVLGEDGQKLSKRHGAVSVMQYEEMGYLPEAMVNFLARLGWGHGDAEVFTRSEFVTWFDLGAINPAPSRFNADKLKWVNHEHLKRLPEDELARRFPPYLARAGLDTRMGPPPGAVALLLRDRVPTLVEMADAAHYFYATVHPPPTLVAELVGEPVRTALASLDEKLKDVAWTRDALGAAMKAEAAKHGLKPGQVMMAMRVLVCGTRETPAIDAVLALLGRDTTLARLSANL